MGLDMYLKAKRYTYKSAFEGDPDYPTPKRDALENALVDIALPEAFDQFGSRKFECTALYWRKANQIHKWFVDNVQGGEDDCRDYYVSVDDLRSLHCIISATLADTTKAQDFLPTEDGFFFGGTEYDEWYWQDLELTKKMLEQILAMPDLDKWDFSYQSSW